MKSKNLFHNYHCESIEDLGKTGVYTIEFINKPHMFYVGSTTVYNINPSQGGFYSRWRRHFNELLLNKHSNLILQNICNKYGIENIRFKILEITSPKLARYSEQYWINLLNTKDRKYGYNIGHVSLKGIRFKMSEKSNRQKSISKSKAVLQYDLLGNFVQEFKSLKIASQKTGISYSSILHGVNDNLQGGGFQWIIKSNENFLLKILPVKNKVYHTKKVNQFNKEKVFIKQFNSVNDAVIFLKCNRPNFIRVLKRKYGASSGYYKGYYWEYSE